MTDSVLPDNKSIEENKNILIKLANEYKKIKTNKNNVFEILKEKHLNNFAADILNVIGDHKSLEALLKSNWDLIKKTLLSYTASPDSDATKLAILAAEYLAENNKEKSALEYLIPTLESSKFESKVSLEKITEKKITEEHIEKTIIKPLNEIIGFHIISDDEKTLILIDLIENLNVGQEDISIQFSTLNNPYDHEKKITNSESNRLQNHSTEIKDYLDKLESYKILLTSDKLSLYSQLNKLL